MRIECELAQPATFVNWYKDGVVLTENVDIRIRKEELRISDVRYEDAGLYSCEGIDGFSSQPWVNYTLRVYSKSLVTRIVFLL